MVPSIYDTGSKGKSGRIRLAEAQQMVQDTSKLVDVLIETTSLVPMHR
jgi:hypothetical protein